MNKMLKGLLVALLAVSAVNAHDHTNKTFLNPRSHGVNLPMEFTTFCELKNAKKSDRFGGNLQVTGFYQESANHHDLAEYFLFQNKSMVELAYGKADAALNANSDTIGDLDLGYLIHNNSISTAETASTKLSLDPHQDAWGIRFDYYQNLDKILKGLYMYFNLPVVEVENHLNINAVEGSTHANIIKFFDGSFENVTTDNLTAKLTHAKIAGHHDETGVADIDIALGYKFLNKEKYAAGLAIAFTIPTGNEADGVWAFESLVGNDKHWALGGDLWATGRVWGDHNENIKLNLKMKYRYLFENSEHRTFGLKGYDFGQYTLLAPITADGKTIKDAKLVPAANITTLHCDVTPGSQFDGILSFAYNNGGFSFDLGYNLYFRECEDVHLKDTVAANYVIAARNWKTSEDGQLVNTAGKNHVDGAADAAAIVRVSNDTLNIGSAETPSQLQNGIFGGLGYTFKKWSTPLMLGLGGQYNWADDADFDRWGVWAKIGIGF
jgi:hypothetical protein